MCRRIVVAISCMLVFGVAVNASAQDKPAPIELSPTQIETNNRAVRLLSETPPKTKEAIKLVEAALLMENKGDLLYLTLGRAYQLDGQCKMAEEQFNAASSAPGVKGVPEEFVGEQLKTYRKELESCMGTLKVVCEPGDLDIRLEGSALVCGEETSLEPGSYTISARNIHSGDELAVPVEVVGGESKTTLVKLGKGKPDGGTVVTPPPTEEPEPTEPKASATHWRLAPYLGGGFSDNVLTQPGEFHGDRNIMLFGGVEGRVLSGTPSLKYGASFDLRGDLGVAATSEFEEEDVTATGGKIGLAGQLWTQDVVGVYAGANLRPRTVSVKDTQDSTEESFGSFGVGLGGGLRFDLGPLLGIAGLELYGGGFYALGLDSIDSDGKSLPSFEAGLRAQIEAFTVSLLFESWSTAADPYLLRTQQGLVMVGWTFGSAK